LLLLIFFRIAAQEAEKTYQSPLRSQIDKIIPSADQKTIIASDTSGYVFFWTLDGSITRILRSHNQVISSIVVSPDGKYFATSSSDGVFVWESATGKKVSGTQKNYIPLSFSPAGDALFFADRSGLFKTSLNDFSKGERIFSVFASGADASDDGKTFAIGEGSILTLISASGTVIAKANSCERIAKIEYKGNRICCLCGNGEIELFEVSGSELKKAGSSMISASLLPKLLITDDKNVLFTDGKKPVLWNVASGKFFDIPGISEPVTALGYGESGKYYTGNSSGKIELRAVSAGEELQPEEKEPETKTGQTEEKETGAEKQVTVEMTTGGIPQSINGRPVQAQNPVVVNSPVLDVYVWDDERQDGDTVSLNFNGKWILQNYMITAEKKKISITLNPGGANYLMLYANNLGLLPPNTAVISFHDGKTEKLLTLESDLKHCDAVNFILKK